jgi:hypothetical protein
MKSKRVTAPLLAIVVSAYAFAGRAQVTNAVYTLLEGSTFIDDCLVCERPTLFYPLRGTFELVLRDSNPLFTTYSVTNISFRVDGGTNPLYTITGTGTYRIGGEVAVSQEMILDVNVNDKALVFTNDSRAVDKLFPLIQVSLVQTQLNLFQFFSMNLLAAPVREIWFSTLSGFTSGTQPLRGTGGDVLSANGRIVKTFSNLVTALGLVPAAIPPGIDALDVGPGGEVFFSFDENRISTNLGAIQHGDLVSSRGRIVARNQTLTAAFGVMPAVPDLGLDAVMVKDDGEILFSIETDAFGETIGKMIHHGDLLSSKGQIVASNAQMLSRFHPGTVKDYGLDAVYVWPSGEIWFSTEEGFQDQQLGPVQAGDLLSDQGFVVFRNLELMSAFAPIEDLADFGLDGLFIITDVTAPAPPPRITSISRQQPSITSLRWEGEGRVFQVQRVADVIGPYLPISPIVPDLMFDDSSASNSAAFYLLRQW